MHVDARNSSAKSSSHRASVNKNHVDTHAWTMGREYRAARRGGTREKTKAGGQDEGKTWFKNSFPFKYLLLQWRKQGYLRKFQTIGGALAPASPPWLRLWLHVQSRSLALSCMRATYDMIIIRQQSLHSMYWSLKVSTGDAASWLQTGQSSILNAKVLLAPFNLSINSYVICIPKVYSSLITIISKPNSL